MKAESNVRPAQFEIIPLDGENVEVLFYENIETLQPVEDEETEKYSYDYYRLIVRNRGNLQATIEANLVAWLQMAKEKEAKDSTYIPTSKDRLAILEDTMNFILEL